MICQRETHTETQRETERQESPAKASRLPRTHEHEQTGEFEQVRAVLRPRAVLNRKPYLHKGLHAWVPWVPHAMKIVGCFSPCEEHEARGPDCGPVENS